MRDRGLTILAYGNTAGRLWVIDHEHGVGVSSDRAQNRQ